MYYTTPLLLSLATLLTPQITATPIPDTSTPSLHPRTYVRTFHFCDGIGYKGHCEDIPLPPKKCVNLSPQLYQKISSMRIGKGETCTLYEEADCFDNANDKDDSHVFHYDTPTLKELGECLVPKLLCWQRGKMFWNDRARSVMCL